MSALQSVCFIYSKHLLNAKLSRSRFHQRRRKKWLEYTCLLFGRHAACGEEHCVTAYCVTAQWRMEKKNNSAQQNSYRLPILQGKILGWFIFNVKYISHMHWQHSRNPKLIYFVALFFLLFLKVWRRNFYFSWYVTGEVVILRKEYKNITDSTCPTTKSSCNLRSDRFRWGFVRVSVIDFADIWSRAKFNSIPFNFI